MSNDDDTRVIAPPNLLCAKVGAKPGPSLAQMVAKAEAALAELKDDYEIWIRDDLKSLRDAVAALHQSHDPKALERIKTLSHEIKGQGATYGYPLLTTAGDLLYNFIARNETVAMKNLELLDAHVDFMALILSEKVDDEGGLQAQGILAGLQEAAKKAHGGNAPPAGAARSAP